jgi:hypothetical protein
MTEDGATGLFRFEQRPSPRLCNLRLMPPRECPKCHGPAFHLAGVSRETEVDYYRCDPCGNIWNVQTRTGVIAEIARPSAQT